MHVVVQSASRAYVCNRVSLCPSFPFFVSPGPRHYSGQITFAIASTGVGVTGQIDPAAVTYRLVSEQHKNVITPVIGSERDTLVERQDEEAERRMEGGMRCLVWQCESSRRGRRAKNSVGRNLVSQWTELSCYVWHLTPYWFYKLRKLSLPPFGAIVSG